MKRKAFWLLGLIAIAAMAMVACGGAEEAPTPAAPAPSAPAPAPAAPAPAATAPSGAFAGSGAHGCSRSNSAHSGASYTDRASSNNDNCCVLTMWVHPNSAM